jgi:deoxyribose-phosphate aldolase
MKANAGTTRHSAPQPPKTPAELAPFIDHTLLRADATVAMVENLCHEAVQHGFYAVCVNGVHVATAHKVLHGVRAASGNPVLVAAVIGFPLGAMTSEVKAFEAKQAVFDGASEVDMVMRIDLAKLGMWDALRDDVAAVVSAVEGRALVKVILETGLLTLEEIALSSRAADAAGAHFVKTCTGFSTAGLPAGAATVEHVVLMRESVQPQVQVKASGGIKDFITARALIAAGASRLGTSSGVALVSSAVGAAEAKESY